MNLVTTHKAVNAAAATTTATSNTNMTFNFCLTG